jgi:putative ABC transport system permease protein
VSVTERTREIGIMKAVGARKRDIVQLFLVESVILGAIGALLGVLVGLGFGFLAVGLIGWPMTYPLDWITIAVAVGIIVGVLSGLYPAWSAARVDPIEALRHE